MLPAESLVIAVFFSEIFFLTIFKSLETKYSSGVTAPETIPSPTPQTASIIILSSLYEGFFERR